MAATAKETVIALATAGAIMFSQVDSNIIVCKDADKDCQQITKEEYNGIKTDLADRITADDPISFEELETVIAILNKELAGGRNIGEMHSRDELKSKLTSILYEK